MTELQPPTPEGDAAACDAPVPAPTAAAAPQALTSAATDIELPKTEGDASAGRRARTMPERGLHMTGPAPEGDDVARDAPALTPSALPASAREPGAGAASSEEGRLEVEVSAVQASQRRWVNQLVERGASSEEPQDGSKP